jgi:hypothetical protein
MGAVAKSYMRKGILIYKEIRKYLIILRRPLVTYDIAASPFWISLYMRKIFFSFLSVGRRTVQKNGKFIREKKA